jgi:DNA-binding CsgD family transcriptional regulator
VAGKGISGLEVSTRPDFVNGEVMQNSSVHLTPREKAILDLILKGLTYKEMSQQLGIAVHTTQNHMTNIYNKIGLNGGGKVSLALWALSNFPEKLDELTQKSALSSFTDDQLIAELRSRGLTKTTNGK